MGALGVCAYSGGCGGVVDDVGGPRGGVVDNGGIRCGLSCSFIITRSPPRPSVSMIALFVCRRDQVGRDG